MDSGRFVYCHHVLLGVLGIIETFHEGWYYEFLLSNLGLMFVQCLSPMLIFMGATLVSLFWPRFGGGLHTVLALLAAWFLEAFTNPVMLILILPLIGIGSLYWFGRPQPRKAAVWLVVGLPLLTLTISGIEPALRVSQRVDDGNLQARLVHGNGVDLVWAPDGPGWPREGTNWHKAQQVCQHLTKWLDLGSSTTAPLEIADGGGSRALAVPCSGSWLPQ